MENVHVEDACSGEESTNYVISWAHNGFRFHVWDKEPSVLYKNPPQGVKRNEPGYFPTRKLDATAKANAAMILAAQERAVIDHLYENAAERKRQKKEDERSEIAGRIRAKKIEEAAPELFRVLKVALISEEWREDARRIIAQIEESQ